MTKAGCCPLQFAVVFGYSHIARLLIEAGAHADRRFREGETPLYAHHAACKQDLETMGSSL